MEEYVYILDYLPQGAVAGGHARKESVCYALGDTEFKLFELVPKASAVVNIGDRAYIGKEPAKRDIIDHVKRRISYEDLTSNAMTEMDYAIMNAVMANQDRFIRFFNEAESISMRKHLLEELPGLGKKYMNLILDERKKEHFKDFADLAERTGIKAPEKLVVSRISLEIKDPERKRYLFVSR